MPVKEYKRRMPFLWWMHNVQTQLFMVRELTSVFAAAYVIYMLVLIGYAGSGDKATFDSALRSPVSIILQIIALAFVVFHSITWFAVAPKAMVFWRGEERVPDAMVSGANYVLWLVMSAVVLLVIFPHT